MNFASQETATDYEGIVHQLQLVAKFLEELSQKAGSEEERQLCQGSEQGLGDTVTTLFGVKK